LADVIFLVSKRRPPKIGGPVQPNTSNMPKAGPGDMQVYCYYIVHKKYFRL